MKLVSGVLVENTGMKIDKPSSDGGTTSIGILLEIVLRQKQNTFLIPQNAMLI